MTPIRTFLATAALGLAISLLAGMVGFVIGGLFLFAMIPLISRGRWAAVAGSLVGFGAGWTALVALQLSRGGTSDKDLMWLAVGVVPLAVGLIVTTILVVLAMRRANGPGGDALP